MLKADLLIKSSAIYTGLSDEVFGGCVAIKGNRILAVTRDRRNDSFIGKSTKVLDFGDALIIPGFNDAHIHLFSASISEDRDVCVDLSSCRSENECVDKVREFLNSHRDIKAVFGRGWNHWKWSKPVMPTGASLDRIDTDRPICLHSWDQHLAWVNTNMLKLSGIDRRVRVSDGGEIGRYENGEPNGLLFEFAAMKYLNMNAQKPPENGQIESFINRAAALGFTSVCDVYPNGMPEESVSGFFRNLNESDLNVRIHFFTGLKCDLSDAGNYMLARRIAWNLNAIRKFGGIGKNPVIQAQDEEKRPFCNMANGNNNLL
jgi:predicted amidohydrolase YtcJ